MDLSKLSPFQRKLIAFLILRGMTSSDPPIAWVKQHTEELRPLVNQGIIEDQISDEQHWVNLTYFTVRQIVAQIYPNVEELENLERASLGAGVRLHQLDQEIV